MGLLVFYWQLVLKVFELKLGFYLIWIISILLDAKYECAVDMDGGGESGKRESRRWGFHMKLLYIIKIYVQKGKRKRNILE